MILFCQMADSFIDSATLDKSQESVRPDQPLTLSLSFRIQGDIRDSFSQKNWERAYNKHDKGFLMKIEIDLKSGRSEEHTSELQSRQYLVCRLLLEKNKCFFTRLY